jgi:pyruvate formate lyase activating enzyme
MATGRIFNIQRCATEDGPGLRTTLFFKGCSMRCIWCHNPEGIDPGFQVMWVESRCRRCGACIDVCPNGAISVTASGMLTDVGKCTVCGKCMAACLNNAREISGEEITVEEAVEVAGRDRVFYRKSEGGVTASGGEAGLQWEFVRDFFQCCREKEIHTALDTCGFVKPENLKQLLAYTDLVLYDLKHADRQRHRVYTGVDSDLVLKNARVISESAIPMWIRIPVVPGYTDSPDNIRKLSDIIRKLEAVERVDLLPYHRLGEAKYRGLGMDYRMEQGLATPAKQHMARLAEIVVGTVRAGVTVTWE